MSFNQKSFELLKGIEENNNKEWFEEHRDQVKAYLQDPFAEMLEMATAKLKRSTFALQGGKQTMFRMNRDIRFAKDKSPYKAHVSGLLTESGSKSEDAGLVYAHLDKSGGFIASGFYQLETSDLNQIRQQIIDQSASFKKIASKLQKAGYDFMQEGKLKTMPRDFSKFADHPLANYLKLKSLVLTKPQTKASWLDGSIVDEIVKLAKDSSDLIRFGTEAIVTSEKKRPSRGI